jgi:hypothetical protein
MDIPTIFKALNGIGQDAPIKKDGPGLMVKRFPFEAVGAIMRRIPRRVRAAAAGA